MKKYFNYIFMIIACMFFQITLVNAKDLFTCTYNVDFNKFGYSVDQKRTIVMTVTDSGATSSLGNGESIGSYYFRWNGNFLSGYASQAKSNNSCPSILFTLSDTAINGYLGNATDSIAGSLSSFVADGSIKKIDSGTSTNTKTKVCSLELTQFNDASNTLRINFYLTGEQKSWSMAKKSNLNQEYNANSESAPIVIDGTLYRINSNDFGNYWDPSKCGEVPIYMQHAMNGPDFVIQSEKPRDDEQGTKDNKSGSVAKDDEGETVATDEKTEVFLNICDASENPRTLATFRLIGIFISIIKIIVPIILIVMGMIDLSKAVIDNKDGNLNKQLGAFSKRAVAGILIFFAPTLFLNIFHLIDGWDGIKSEYETCIDCLLGDKDCPKVGFTD